MLIRKMSLDGIFRTATHVLDWHILLYKFENLCMIPSEDGKHYAGQYD